MSAASLPKLAQVTTRRRSKDVFVERKPHVGGRPGGEVFRYNLETVLQLLSAEGDETYNAWTTEQLLRTGMPVRSQHATWQVIDEHVEPALPTTTADDPAPTYKLLQTLLTPEQMRIVDDLLTNIRSRLNNLAQVTTFNAEAWADHDAEIQKRLDHVTSGLVWAATELDVLMGGGLGRAREIPAFSFPACWTDLIPAETQGDR